jgi:radical SAM protein with 4Fe4S-binding SPASM domain
MGLELFQKIIEELGDYIWHLTLWNWGEPFICPDIYEMITLAERKGIFTRISTNGHFLTAGHQVERLLTTGLDNLLVAIDGASEETFSLYRQKGDWEKVVAGLKEIMARKKRQRLFRPRVELQFMVMKHNEHELLRIQSLAREIGVDRLTFKTVNIKFGPGDNKEKIDKFLPQRNYLSRYQPHSTQRKVYLKNKCYRLWFSSVINWDGTVTPCCYDAHGHYSFGHIQEKGFSKVWNNTAYRQFRAALLKDKKVIRLCQDCPGLLMGLNLSL